MEGNIVTNPASPVEVIPSQLVLPEKSREKPIIKILIALLAVTFLVIGSLGAVYFYQYASQNSSSSSASLTSSSSSTNSFDVDTTGMKELRNAKYGFALLYNKDFVYKEWGTNSSSTFVFSASLVPITEDLKGRSIDISVYDRGAEDFHGWVGKRTISSYNEDTSRFTDGVYFVNEQNNQERFQFKGHNAIMFPDLLLTVQSIRFIVEKEDKVISIMYTFVDRSPNLKEDFLDTLSSFDLSGAGTLGISSAERNELSSQLAKLTN